ncbi:hypothetical protein [Mucilaginibacter boryungensis]|uniref:Uncharacterized protein n=1 Tax=Mucilaginibacter boryungensis TaxID=768480 RepID=A0ABR9XNB6_9SPHI|nr:hypothetical protein [Mucilaginibacter boryungensis]MBE9668715.1 hypothetical protein [Mucilaginibacter boryungensis]
MNIYNKLHGETIAALLNDGRPKLTAKQFLGKDGTNAYYNNETLLSFVKTLRPQEISEMQEILKGMSEGLRIVGTIASRTDKGGRRYAYLNLQHVNANTGGKFILEDGTTRFLNDYMNGKFVVGFTLEELVEEAMNA